MMGIINIIEINNMALLQHRRHAVSLPFHLTQEQRKLSQLYALRKSQPKEHLSSCNFITPVVREGKKLPISGEVGSKLNGSREQLSVSEYLSGRRQEGKVRQGEGNKQINKFQVPIYLRLKKIKRQHQFQLNGQIYVKQTEQQLKKRAKEFVKLIQSKKDKFSKKPPLLKRGQYEKKILQNEINQCQQSILKNQYLIEKRVRMDERLKNMKIRQMNERYSGKKTEQTENVLPPSINIHSPKLIKLSLESINQQSKNYSKIQPQDNVRASKLIQNEAQECLKPSESKYFLTEGNYDQVKYLEKDQFRMQNQQMLKKLITLVKKKQRLDFLQKMQDSEFKYY